MNKKGIKMGKIKEKKFIETTMRISLEDEIFADYKTICKNEQSDMKSLTSRLIKEYVIKKREEEN